MVEINGAQYENPYIKIATKDRAQLIHDAISYRMGFRSGAATERLAELMETPDGDFVFPHPAGIGFETWEDTIKGVTAYSVVEYDPSWVVAS